MSFATEIEQAADTLLDGFVTQKSAALAAALTPVAFVGFSLYIIVLGYGAARGQLRDPLTAPLGKFMRFGIVATLALMAGQYQSLAVEGLRGVESGLIGALSGTSTVGAAIDTFMVPFDELSRVMGQELSEQMVPDLLLLLTMGIVVAAEVIIVGIGLGYYLLSKIALALLFAIGPAFILCAAFPPTQRYAESWFGQVLNFILLNVLIVGAFTLVATLAEQFAQSVLSTYSQGGQILRDAIALLILCASLAILMLNLSAIAMGLAGGIALGGGEILPAMALGALNPRGGNTNTGDGLSLGKGPASASPTPSPTSPGSQPGSDSVNGAPQHQYQYQYPTWQTAPYGWRKRRSK
ncbi:type IV secretion system protein [Asticcacaulis excentricus]|uniref:TrbL/VirB6 plasmid conjugal transfer protein n=1 Tax=Asticcacaulis excentricus (strain ATCC 15261 / DSM 4724 / KCTC 12464 / NCIMB 9791 / VKM B-1370 / CB 48) TaxID=573065 RepID=E8RME6_ASTEC|nr:type IV secretion system protein [Asticcacaulis excentricus]ADU13897.1 TrbL/VirB6 plasmid conjugal transfer protein [Asticcacaulis excentricus CB 48]